MTTAGWGATGGGAWGGGGGAWGGGGDKPLSGSAAPYEEFKDSKDESPAYGTPAPAYETAITIDRAVPGPSSAATNTAAREAELGRKEAALAAKEKELKAMEERMKASGVIPEPAKNWPVCWPWVYHDISVDIPDGNPRRVVKEGYATWWGMVVCMLWNFFCAAVMLSQKVEHKTSSFLLAAIYLLVGIPTGFFLWYRQLYLGCKGESTISMLGFFITFIAHIGFCTWAAIAVPFSQEYWSFAGFVAATRALDVSLGCGAIFFVGSALWTLEALYSLWVLKDVFFFFKGKGGIEQAKRGVALASMTATAYTSSNNAWR